MHEKPITDGENITRIVHEIVPLRRTVSIEDGMIYLPGLDDDSRALASDIEQALRSEGYTVGGLHRAYYTLSFEVPKAVKPDFDSEMHWMKEGTTEKIAFDGEE